MSKISASVKLRPTRIALLVRPNDLTSIRKFMRLNACLWGGVFNPIIPVFRNTPMDWRDDAPRNMTGYQVANGYARFFEPDVYVEAEEGLLEKVGLASWQEEDSYRSRVCALDDLFAADADRDWAEPAFGLGIVDALSEIYRTEQRFTLRDHRIAKLPTAVRGNALVEAMFGVYPADGTLQYVKQAYQDVFRPDEIEPGPDLWRSLLHGAATPLNVTRYKLEQDLFWNRDLTFFVFDPNKTTDLIDLWNMRLEPTPMIPIPLDWWEDLLPDIEDIIRRQHRPLQGNPNGIMHSTLLEFARSISEERAVEAFRRLDSSLPDEAWAYKAWRNPVWAFDVDQGTPHSEPLYVSAAEKRVTLEVAEEGRLRTEFVALAPEFAERYGGGFRARWVNVVKLDSFFRHDVAAVLPFNMSDPDWPDLGGPGETVTIGKEGWVFAQRFKDSTEWIDLLTHEEAIIGSLKRLGIQANLSEPGAIAKQMLDNLGGLWGRFLIADRKTIQLLNEMAGGFRRMGDGVEETEQVFDRRTRPQKQWVDLVARRRSQGPGRLTLSRFTDHNIIRLGVTTKCPYCSTANWHSLSEVEYEQDCDRCLKSYPFPQGELMSKNGNWSYRAIGPFATPDYARGSYGALLALDVIDDLNLFRGRMTFCCGMEMEVDDGHPCEADFVAWVNRESRGASQHPQLVIGETKSFGDGDLIKSKDLAQLRRIAKKLPGAVIVISVMRDSFTENEKRILRPFVKWCRRLDKNWFPTNPVILLTGLELFRRINISHEWETMGGRFEPYSNHQYSATPNALAESTQAIYLNFPSFHEDRVAEWRRRQERRRH